jgi:uncharacterized protein YcfJ
MNKVIIPFILLCFLYPVAGVAAEDHAKVIRSVPRYATVYHQHCRTEQVATDNSGVGTVIGGVAGGILGNQVGGGSGKDVATVLGAVVGASVGNRIGQDQVNVENRNICQQIPTSVQVGEVVTFLYKGKTFSVNINY